MVPRISSTGPWLLLCAVVPALVEAVGGSPASTVFNPVTFFGGTNHDAYLDWYNHHQKHAYVNDMFLESELDDTQGLAVHWSINLSTLHLAVAARATGWVGFGLSENGGMKGADIVLFRAAQPDRVFDMYVLDDLVPREDDCQSWQLVGSFVRDGFVVMEVTRAVNTLDTQDRPIVFDGHAYVLPAMVIGAWGDEEMWGYHGDNRVKGTIAFYRHRNQMQLFRSAMDEYAMGYVDLTADDYLIPARETKYKDFCFGPDDLLERGVPIHNTTLTIVGFEPLIDPQSRRHVHHFVMTGGGGTSDSAIDTNGGSDSSNGDREGLCRNNLGDSLALDRIFVWAPGTAPRVLPNNVGIPMGVGGLQYFNIQTHYDNPELLEDQPDSSGIRIYYTTEQREYTEGSFLLADARVRLWGQPVGEGYTRHTFDCPASCTVLALSDGEPITVYQEDFHMHQSGVRAVNRLIRDGKVVHTTSVEFFDFEHNGDLVVPQEPFQVFPGDYFHTECFYHNPVSESASRGLRSQVFGIGTRDEMCIVGLRYYPHHDIDGGEAGRFTPQCSYNFQLPQCEAEYSPTPLADIEGLERVFGTPAGEGTEAVCLSLEELVLTVATTPEQQQQQPSQSESDASNSQPVSPKQESDSETVPGVNGADDRQDVIASASSNVEQGDTSEVNGADDRQDVIASVSSNVEQGGTSDPVWADISSGDTNNGGTNGIAMDASKASGSAPKKVSQTKLIWVMIYAAIVDIAVAFLS